MILQTECVQDVPLKSNCSKHYTQHWRVFLNSKALLSKQTVLCGGLYMQCTFLLFHPRPRVPSLHLLFPVNPPFGQTFIYILPSFLSCFVFSGKTVFVNVCCSLQTFKQLFLSYASASRNHGRIYTRVPSIASVHQLGP